MILITETTFNKLPKIYQNIIKQDNNAINGILNKSVNMEVAEKIICFYERKFGSGIDRGKIYSPFRGHPFVQIRQICMYMMTKKGISYTETGQVFGRDHSTCTHSVDIVDQKIAIKEVYFNINYAEDIEQLSEMIL